MPALTERKSFPVIIASIGAAIWLISNINCPLRFTLHPVDFTNWHITAIAANFIIAAVFLLRTEWRKFSFYPLFFNVHPLLYVLMSYVLPAIVGVDYEADITVKFMSDIIYFIFEIALFLPFILFLKNKNPLNTGFIKKDFRGDLSARPGWFRIFFLTASAIFLVGVWILAFVYPSTRGIPAEIVRKLVVMQIVFAVTLGFKEELIFRWILQNRMKSDTGSIAAAVVFQSVVWMLYHVFFGEGTGTGFLSGLMTLVAAVYWGYCSHAFKNIWIPFLGHIGIELFGFYLMYEPFIVEYLM